ncbi:helicase [Nocardiopsis gilva YIM 90087]|uniref:Helicase n=1 Tax=Nocardiopsis gilva YIM 90087 TaxID=1235441 RepID=A0A223S6E4_9ACTN|nr:ATP-binding domain-containing protein [Nocardiopsis gilva]ASU83678.1 helicase [Nocardiopsis gilva YIM 90087]
MELRQSDDGSARTHAIRAEQAYVTGLYERLDTVRQQTRAALRAADAAGGRSGYSALMDREARSNEQARRLSQLSGVENGLCFGRIDHRGDRDGDAVDTLYIGRIGLRDESHETILVDWRAPAARPFYAATPVSPGDLVRRRHLHTRDRVVTGIDDEVFDLDGLSDTDRRSLVGEAALLAALRRGRTGRMNDIVATIQSEQDRVIRSRLQGVLVVQGGPGTGKTVAALHRAAYLLYTHRDTLKRRGVLVVGPNPTFLRYIGRVLPSLGESDVVLSTVGELYPGVRATASDPVATALVKGSDSMVGLVRAAVADRQRVPSSSGMSVSANSGSGDEGASGGTRDLEIEVDDMTLRVDHADCLGIRDRTRSLRLPHNVARKFFVTEMLRLLARNQAEQLDPMLDPAEPAYYDETDLDYMGAALWQQEPVRRGLDELWPLLTPQRLLETLYADDAALARVGAEAGLTESEWKGLSRPLGSPRTVGDVPLLDEAAELLGEDDAEERARRRRVERDRADAERYAQGVLEFTGLFEDPMMGASALAERHDDADRPRSTAERAEADRTWAYGHVIVDEAQELSAMAWRMVMRRIPTRSLTVVGDIAQTGSPAGARSWSSMLAPYAHGRLHEERLLVNYRTPAQIMAVAADVLAEVAPDQQPPESVRDDGDPPRAVRVGAEGSDGTTLAEALPRLVEEELTAIGEGRLVVIVPDARHTEIAGLLPDAAADATPDALDSPSTVLTTTRSKGLEFDSVIVVEPGEILEQSPQGGHDLYVALTRATRRLTVIHEALLPDMLGRISRQAGPPLGGPCVEAPGPRLST